MECRCVRILWLGLIGWSIGSTTGLCGAQEKDPQAWTKTPVPWEEVTQAVSARAQQVMARPILAARGPTEVFACVPPVYHWFLDHPDRAVVAWRRLGAKCIEITDRGNGRFGWTDGAGSDIHWDTVFRGPRMRVWYAEGKVRPGLLLPPVPVQAVLVLRFNEGRDGAGQVLMRHQADLSVHTDSRGAALVTKMLGAAGPRMAQNYAGQMEMFFSLLSWYLGQHPDRLPELIGPPAAPATTTTAKRAGQP